MTPANQSCFSFSVPPVVTTRVVSAITRSCGLNRGGGQENNAGDSDMHGLPHGAARRSVMSVRHETPGFAIPTESSIRQLLRPGNRKISRVATLLGRSLGEPGFIVPPQSNRSRVRLGTGLGISPMLGSPLGCITEQAHRIKDSIARAPAPGGYPRHLPTGMEGTLGQCDRHRRRAEF